jgi:hypothetical protein
MYDPITIANQMIATLKNDEAHFQGVDVRLHQGEINAQTLLDPAYMETVITVYPFVFIQPQGATLVGEDDTRTTANEEVVFRFFVGSQNVSDKTLAIVEAQNLLQVIHGLIRGYWVNGQQSLYDDAKIFSGDKILDDTFVQMRAFGKTKGQSNALIANLPHICVYRQDYSGVFVV